MNALTGKERMEGERFDFVSLGGRDRSSDRFSLKLIDDVQGFRPRDDPTSHPVE
jgi:hypothetical protein